MKSMTGFARAEGADTSATWYVEMRSVNGRGLDVRFRLPPGGDGLEARMREAITKRLARGSVSVLLQVDKPQLAPQIRLNEAALAQVMVAAERVRALTGAPAPTVEGLLGLRGVLEVADVEEGEDDQAARGAAILATFEAALDQLVEARAAEGARLKDIIGAALDEIETLIGKVASSPARQPAAIAARLNEQVARLAGAAHGLDMERLHQEAVLLATRADVEEEVQRLGVHIAAARELLAFAGPAGRKFDFLVQEFNREANTLCSKANDPDISRNGLAMKVLIDQMREQIANIE